MLDRGMTQAYAATLIMAVLPIILGSFSSLRASKRTKRLLREQAGEDASAAADDDKVDEVERITFEDAWMFPILGSCLLGGLWLMFKYVDRIWINWAIGWYFTLAGVLSVFTTSSTVLAWLTPRAVAARLPEYTLAITDRTSRLVDLKLPFLALPSVPLALYIPFVYSRGKVWWANNVLSFTFAHSAIALLALDSFPTAFTLLAGLFVYDCWWVFGTTVMVDVAKGLEAPVKMVFPKDQAWGPAKGFTMLGLGDIIIPGIVLALALRLDYSLASRAAPSSAPLLPSGRFAKPYFLTALAGYVGGLATTIWVMHRFQAAQPALLYLVPACIGSIVLVALVKGELPLLWKWTDGEDDALEAAHLASLNPPQSDVPGAAADGEPAADGEAEGELLVIEEEPEHESAEETAGGDEGAGPKLRQVKKEARTSVIPDTSRREGLRSRSRQ